MMHGQARVRSYLRRLVLGLAAIALAVAGAMASPAGAVAADAGSDGKAPQTVEELLAFYPGSQQVGPFDVEISPGVAVSLPAGPGVEAVCASKYLCFWSNAGYSGYRLNLYYCQLVNLGNLTYPGGGRWNDKVSSLVNNQTSGTRSHFYNYLGSNSWQFLFTSTAYNERFSLGSNNNKIDRVSVC